MTAFFMYRLYLIFFLILIFIFQCTKGQGRSVGNITDGPDESSDINENCIGSENYCCNYAAAQSSHYPDENHEVFVNTSKSSAGVLFGPVLVIISLLVLRALSKRVEE